MTENRLHNSSSPYLLQYANDPVHWQAWDEQALDLARTQNKPILLSIGYSACHWCHVMAKESFENAQIASIMNEHFVNIKVDREQRPDLDKIYQMTHQLLLQQPGGWPLTAFLTPDQYIPFFVGTYFPPEARDGMPSFPEIITRISDYYQNEGEQIKAQGLQIKEFFNSFDQREAVPISKLDNIPINKAISLLEADYDQVNGGFGGAPKFSFASTLDLFLKQWAKTAYDDEPNRNLLYMVSHSLQQMAKGGLYDQVGGGFYHYSIDAAWNIPHFEKTLYDNAQLIPLYAQLFQISGDSYFKDIAIDSVKWLIDDMQSEASAFYATVDADSEDGEGKFYVWSREELESILSIDEFYLMQELFNLNSTENFNGSYHLKQISDVLALAESLQKPQEKIKQELRIVKLKLLAHRNLRKRPTRDDKLLTAWNALLVKGLSITARSLDEKNIQKTAKNLLLNIWQDWKNHTALHVQIGENKQAKLGFIDDYAFTLEAILEQLQNEWDTDLLDWAIEIADVLVNNFASDNGGFYFTSNKDPESLLYRPLTFTDDALPSGNASAAKSLLCLGYLIDNNEYLKIAEKTLQTSYFEMDKSPQAHASLLSVLDEYLEPAVQVIIRGESDEIEIWKENLQKIYSPKLQIFAINNNETNLPAAINSKMIAEITTAYVCQGLNCSEAINDFNKLLNILN